MKKYRFYFFRVPFHDALEAVDILWIEQIAFDLKRGKLRFNPTLCVSIATKRLHGTATRETTNIEHLRWLSAMELAGAEHEIYAKRFAFTARECHFFEYRRKQRVIPAGDEDRSSMHIFCVAVIPPEISTVLFVSCAQLYSSSVLCLAATSNIWYVLRFIQIGKFIHKTEIFYFLRISTLATSSSSAESSRTIPRLSIWAHRSSLALCVLSSIAVVSRCVWNFTVDREIISSQSCALRSCRNNRLRTANTKAISLRKSSRERRDEKLLHDGWHHHRQPEQHTKL